MEPVLLKIGEILRTQDSAVSEFVYDICRKSSNLEQFQTKIDELDVDISHDVAFKVYDIARSRDLDSTAKVVRILHDALSLDDPVVADFIVEICSKCKSLEEFTSELEAMDCGIEPGVSRLLYAAMEEEKPKQRNHGALGMPNQKIRWDSSGSWADSSGQDTIRTEASVDERPILGKVYPGVVKKITAFGCFVRILGVRTYRSDGLVHISELAPKRIRDPADIVSIDQKVYVKIIKIQDNGKISLRMKNIDQRTGREEEASQERGRNTNRQEKSTLKRKLTSPERWEIRQLISSGAASAEDYPELQDTFEQERGSSQKPLDNAIEEVEVELKTDDEPQFLKGEASASHKLEMPKLTKVPQGSLTRTALSGSNLMSEHRAEKIQKSKEVENERRKHNLVDDPSSRQSDLNYKNKQDCLSAWERSRNKENIEYGKRTSLPIQAQRESLPVFKMRDLLVDAIRDNQFLVIVGETGSGKTTQITQYLDEEGFSKNGIIGCTQPRRVAAISVAKRVAEEVGCRLGEDVGYTIRFENETSNRTRIKYMTDGMLQQEVLVDPLMSKYSVILLDEAHERTIATDVLFALLKGAAARRPDLRIIVTSATLDAEKFSAYFFNCPVLKIPGRTFPVEVLYSQSPQLDYIETTLDTVMEIHINEGRGDILVFLTGQEEIDTCCEVLYERVKTLGDTIQELLILPVYSALPSEVQSKIFEPTPPNCRKVIFATNIAETSITIDGIFYVVDPGFSKVNTYNPRMGMEQLIISPISQAQANQRKGRAGRTGAGKCYRLYTESAFLNEMMPNTIPEIQRQNLSYTILMLKAMGINDLLNFEFMDPPPRVSMVGALEDLYNLQALDEEGKLSKLGALMSQFPMEPALSKALIASTSRGCSDELSTIISMLSVQSVFYRPRDKQQEADNKKARFHHPYGDHLTLLNVYNRWRDDNFSKTFCVNNYLHERHLKRAKDVKLQLVGLFKKLRLSISNSSGDVDVIRSTLVSGFFRNAAKRESQTGYKTISDGTSVAVHPSSSLFGKDYDYVIYHSLVLTTREYMSFVTAIDPRWLVESAPHYYKVSDGESESRKKAKIVPLHNKFSQNQDSWRLSSLRQTKEKALGIRR